MDFVVVGRHEIEAGLPIRVPHVIISIATPRKRSPSIRRTSLCGAILFLRFDDAEPTEGWVLPCKIKMMTERQARMIWRLVTQHFSQIKTIVVHCEAGFSRSPAVAAALCAGLGGDNSRFFREYQPNQYVYDLMVQTQPGKLRGEVFSNAR